LRKWLALGATTAGSIAFQMSVDAGYMRNYAWAIPWVWALCVSVWALWLLTHQKVTRHWFGHLHERAGNWIYIGRTLILAAVFLMTGFSIRAALHRVEAHISRMPASEQQAKQSPPEPEKPKQVSNKNKFKPKRPAPPIQQDCPQGICIAGDNSGNPTVNNYGTPAPKVTYTISELPISEGEVMWHVPVKYKAKVTIKTDRELDHLSFGLFFDGAFLSAEVGTSFSQYLQIDDSFPPIPGFNGFNPSDQSTFPKEYHFALIRPSALMPDGEIYVKVSAREADLLPEI